MSHTDLIWFFVTDGILSKGQPNLTHSTSPKPTSSIATKHAYNEAEDITEVSNNVANSTVKTVSNKAVNCPSGKIFNLFL